MRIEIRLDIGMVNDRTFDPQGGMRGLETKMGKPVFCEECHMFMHLLGQAGSRLAPHAIIPNPAAALSTRAIYAKAKSKKYRTGKSCTVAA
jgi:hypothetical protein